MICSLTVGCGREGGTRVQDTSLWTGSNEVGTYCVQVLAPLSVDNSCGAVLVLTARNLYPWTVELNWRIVIIGEGESIRVQ